MEDGLSAENPYIIEVGHQVRHDEHWRIDAGKIEINAVLVQ